MSSCRGSSSSWSTGLQKGSFTCHTMTRFKCSSPGAERPLPQSILGRSGHPNFSSSPSPSPAPADLLLPLLWTCPVVWGPGSASLDRGALLLSPLRLSHSPPPRRRGTTSRLSFIRRWTFGLFRLPLSWLMLLRIPTHVPLCGRAVLSPGYTLAARSWEKERGWNAPASLGTSAELPVPTGLREGWTPAVNRSDTREWWGVVSLEKKLGSESVLCP